MVKSAGYDDLTTFDDKAIFDTQFISEIPKWFDTWVNVPGSFWKSCENMFFESVMHFIFVCFVASSAIIYTIVKVKVTC